MLHLSAFVVKKFGTNDCEVLATGTHFNADNSPVHHAILELETMLTGNTPEGSKMRALFEDVMILHRNKVHRTYHFADPAAEARQAATQRLYEAEQLAKASEEALKAALAPAAALAKAREETEAASKAVEARRAELAALPPLRPALPQSDDARALSEQNAAAHAKDAADREAAQRSHERNAAAQSPQALAAAAAALPPTSAAAMPPATEPAVIPTPAEKAAKADLEKEEAKDRIKGRRSPAPAQS
jgi:hypothetical protein